MYITQKQNYILKIKRISFLNLNLLQKKNKPSPVKLYFWGLHPFGEYGSNYYHKV